MRPQLGVCYYPEHWQQDNWQNDARRMKETDLQWVRIGEFSWSQIEAQQGIFTWDWLDSAITILGQEGLQIVLGTPTATPPAWMVTSYPDMLAVDSTGNPRTFGSRRHYCFSHSGYRQAAARMAEAMAERYGQNPHIAAWQIDNEYGCHNTTLSFSAAALQAFRLWLAQKYRTPAALNDAWGNVFWSMEYTSFDQIELPNLTVTEASPSHWLDFRRFSSDQVIAFNRAQVLAMRPYTHQPLIHNYMGKVLDFDHFTLAADLQIASWDSYPIGFLEEVIEATPEWKRNYCRQGDPDFQAFHHDLYRAVGRGRWWVMEQQPGPVNWAGYNPIPARGMIKLWTMEAVAHGAEVVSYFRWRQLPFAQEQMHSGLLAPDGSNAQGQREVSQLAAELAELGDLRQLPAAVAIVFDYPSQWAWQTQPQGKTFTYFDLVFAQYRALRSLGLNIDFIPSSTTDLGTRKLVLIPGLMAWNDNLRTAIARFDGMVIAGPRTGSKTPDMHIAQPHPDFAGARVTRAESLPPDLAVPLQTEGKIIHWREELTADQVYLQDAAGQPVVARRGHHLYLGSWLDQTGYTQLFKQVLDETGTATTQLPDGLRRRSVDSKTLIVNYNPHPVSYADTEKDRWIESAGYIWLRS